MTATTNQATHEDQIRRIVEDLGKALRTKDADLAVSHYAAENVMFVLAPPLQHTPKNSPGKKGVEEWFATFQGPIDSEMRDLKITTGNDVAFCHLLKRMTGTNTDGEKVDLWFRETLGFRRIDDQWQITHQHESVPFYMDGSYKAAVDLKP